MRRGWLTLQMQRMFEAVIEVEKGKCEEEETDVFVIELLS